MSGLLILILGIFIFTRGLLRFKKVTRLEFFLIPLYSLVLAFFSIYESMPKLVDLIATIIVGIFAAIIQSMGAQIKRTEQRDKYQRPIVMLKKGWSYLFGWIIIFTYGISYALINGEKVDILEEIGTEIMKDLFTFENFATVSSWNIYLLSGIASLCYLLILKMKEPLLLSAIAKRNKDKKTSIENERKHN